MNVNERKINRYIVAFQVSNTEYFENYLLNTCKDARYTYKSSNVGRLTNELNIT